jgi:hypothetical protein
LEKEQHNSRRFSIDLEHQGFLASGAASDEAFQKLLDAELQKVTTFFHTQERELQVEFENLEEVIKQRDVEGTAFQPYHDDPEHDDDDEDDEEEGDGSQDPSRFNTASTIQPRRNSTVHRYLDSSS